jgi:hypothetical protein
MGETCINCEAPAEHMHHVVPKVLGGGEGRNLVPMCTSCHGLVHGKKFLDWKALQKAGIAKAKARGAYKGRKSTIDKGRIRSLRAGGMSTYKIADVMKISRMTVHRTLNGEKGKYG